MRGGPYPRHGGRLAFMSVAVLAEALTAVVVGVPGNTADSVPRAAALLNKVVLPAGAVRRSRAPTALLDWPDHAGSTTVVRLSRFWTVPGGTALEVQHALGALQTQRPAPRRPFVCRRRPAGAGDLRPACATPLPRWPW